MRFLDRWRRPSAVTGGPSGGARSPRSTATLPREQAMEPIAAAARRVLVVEDDESLSSLVVHNLAPRSLGPHDFDPWSAEQRRAFEDAVREATALVTLRSVSLAEHFDSLYPRARAVNGWSTCCSANTMWLTGVRTKLYAIE